MQGSERVARIQAYPLPTCGIRHESIPGSFFRKPFIWGSFALRMDASHMPVHDFVQKIWRCWSDNVDRSGCTIQVNTGWQTNHQGSSTPIERKNWGLNGDVCDSKFLCSQGAQSRQGCVLLVLGNQLIQYLLGIRDIRWKPWFKCFSIGKRFQLF